MTRMIRVIAVALCMTATLMGSAEAGSFLTFTDRAAWEQAAANAGLAVTTETFASAPNLASFSVDGATFSATAAYDGVNQRLEQCCGSDILLDFTAVSPGTGIFGFGYDFAEGAGPRIRVTDTDGVQGSAFSDDITPGFLGILGTATFDPNSTWFGGFPEIHHDGPPGSVVDNVSVASAVVGVPMPAPLVLLVSAVTGLAAVRAWRRR